MSEHKTWDDRLAAIAENLKTIWPVIVLMAATAGSGYLWVKDNFTTEEEVKKDIAQAVEDTSPCLAFPDNQHLEKMRVRHTATDARPGEESKITWYELERLKACGAPCIVGWIINGDGRERFVKTSLDRPLGPCTRGKSLAAGRQPPFTYSFVVPETATPGCAVFFIHLKFDEHPDRIESPWVPFTILNPDGSMPDVEGEACV